ncbi:something about silencing protein 10 [Elasticomyces elasticus]|nr:something about silencing protein 10 [Elasticomyces elasticus]
MAKRKSSSRVQEPAGPNLDVGSSRKRIRTYEDVADSDDEFYLQRDRVLLGEEPDAKRRRKVQEQEEFLELSDEEVLDYEEAESEEEDDEDVEDGGVAAGEGGVESESDEGNGEVEEDEERGWGTTKADLYGADEIETEEQALEEEAEALRLQKKQLQALSAADYGFDEAEWQNGDKAGDAEDDAVVTEVLPQLQVTADMSAAERLKLLKSRYPEFEPLRKELLQLQDTHAVLAQKVKAATSTNDVTKFRAASAYLGALTMYFTLLTSTASRGEADVVALSATRLRDHPVMDSLVQCRELWSRAKVLPSRELQAETDESGDDSAVEEDVEEAVLTQPAPKKASRAQKHAEAAQLAAEARKAERMAKTEAELADLDALVATSKKSKPKPTKASRDDASDIGEEAPLTAKEAADKASRKKSLRFYTSQIAQKANKRGASGRNAGGDEDVPHRERLRDRQARLNDEAEKRGKGRSKDVGDDLGGESADEEDVKQAKRVRGEGGDGEDYYDLVASRTAKKKTEKAALAEAQRLAALQGGVVVEEEKVGADGKRKISYLIEKNKGLTPHRKKDVRNPRVKKRKKYDEKKKKLASMKPTYKGGEGKGGYGVIRDASTGMESIITGHSPLNDLSSTQAFNLITSFLVLAIALPFLLALHQDYLAFVALGPGGTPTTFGGFLRVKVLSLFALSDPYVPAPIPQRFQATPGYLVDLAKRQHPRPCTRGIAPHRQITQKAGPALYKQLATAIEAIAGSNETLCIGTSCFEKHGTGLFSTSPAKRTCGGEICHAHPSDGSMHLTLHPLDAKIVLEAGWAERHPLARGGWLQRFVPGGFVMVYAPESEEDIAVLLEIVKAAAWYVSGGDGVKDGVDERRDSGYASADSVPPMEDLGKSAEDGQP